MMLTIADGFRKAEIWPFDRTVFSEDDSVVESLLLKEESNNNVLREYSNQVTLKNNVSQTQAE